MRQIILILGLLFAASATQAAEPKVRIGAPYPQVRAELIRQGFIPQKVTVKDYEEACDQEDLLCRLYPELTSCSGAGRHSCNFLFRNAADGVYWIVSVDGEIYAQRDFPRFKVINVWRAYDDMVKAMSPAGRAEATALHEPVFRKGASYPEVRQSFIRQGFSPQEPSKRAAYSCDGQRLCQLFPEILSCGDVGDVVCDFLFKGAAGEGWWRVTTFSKSGTQPEPGELKVGLLKFVSDQHAGMVNAKASPAAAPRAP